MASSIGNLPYTQRLEYKTTTPYYHAHHICGSNFHALAQTIQGKLQKGEFNEALEQIQRCIDARLNEMAKRSFPDPAHNKIVQQLRNFISLVQRLETSVARGDISQKKLFETTIVRYVEKSEPHHFEILIGSMGNEQILQGGRKTRKGKSRKRRRSNTHRSRTHKRSKTRRSRRH